MAEKAGDRAGAARAECDLGTLWARERRFAEANAALEKGVASWRALATEDPERRQADLAAALSDLLVCYLEQGRYAEAAKAGAEAEVPPTIAKSYSPGVMVHCEGPVVTPVPAQTT